MPMALGALWEGWRGPDGEVVRSFAIVTTPASREVAGLHDRMPLILHYFGGMNREEMAKELGVKPGTLAVRMHRGREMLGKHLTRRGVHLASGSDVRAARRLLGPDMLIGLSIHSAGEAIGLAASVLDYTVAGPVHATASKPGLTPPNQALSITAQRNGTKGSKL